MLWREYAEARALVPAGNLTEISYAELTFDPTAAVGRVYRELRISGFEERGVRARVAERWAQLGGYRTNCYEPLPAGLRERVAARCALGRVHGRVGVPVGVVAGRRESTQ